MPQYQPERNTQTQRGEQDKKRKQQPALGGVEAGGRKTKRQAGNETRQSDQTNDQDQMVLRRGKKIGQSSFFNGRHYYSRYKGIYLPGKLYQFYRKIAVLR